MFMQLRTLTLISVSLALARQAQAQVLQVTGGDYFIIAETRAHTDMDGGSESGSNSLSSYSRSLESFSEFDDPNLGLHTAHGVTSLLWTQSTVGAVTTMSGGVGGIAEAVSNGLDTYATGASSVSVYFTITTDANARLESQGTYNSDLYVFDGTNWVGFYTGFNGSDNIFMAQGQYKLNSSAGETVTGYNYYSSGVQFSVEAQAVPEPGTILAVGAGLLALARRRKSA